MNFSALPLKCSSVGELVCLTRNGSEQWMVFFTTVEHEIHTYMILGFSKIILDKSEFCCNESVGTLVSQVFFLTDETLTKGET